MVSISSMPFSSLPLDLLVDGYLFKLHLRTVAEEGRMLAGSYRRISVGRN
jgi:hypothetical protein